MATNNTANNNFRNKGKDIKYLNTDFAGFRENLIEFSKTYFPKTYNDFNETSPGMMFMELSSYIGDVLSYYVDDTLKESLMPFAEDERSVIALAQFLGYKPKVTSPAITTLSVYQLLPSVGTGQNNVPDERFCLRIKEGMTINSIDNEIQFTTTDIIDFADPFEREITVYTRDVTTGEPNFYLIKKYAQAISSTIVEKEFTFGNQYEPFRTITLPETDVIQIVDIRDSNGAKYYEVPYLGQEMVFINETNTISNNSDLYQFRNTVPYLLKTLKTARRFTLKINENKTTTIQFGAGDPSTNDEQLIPNLKNVGLGLPNSIRRLEESFDPTNFLKTKTYGTSPTGTTITVRYLVGGGVTSNLPQGVLTQISGVEYEEDLLAFNQNQRIVYTRIKNSLAVDNEVPAVGGRGPETLEEIRQNALANFGAQNRAVTARDYQVRVLSLPSKYGGIAKAYASADGTLDNNSPSSILASPNALQQFTDIVMDFVEMSDNEEPTEGEVKEQIRNFLIGKTDNVNETNNPFAINLYLLGYNQNGNLTPINKAIKQNLKTYLNEYRMLTDGVNILDGFVVNIGVEFEIITLEGYNKSEVVTQCINEIRNFFQIDKWTFNQTINLSELELVIANVEGVSSVPKLHISNKCKGQYSTNSYNIDAATKDKIIYPSLDPCVFEIKFPNSDIKGRAR
jgi:hypothetical protein